MICDAKLRGSTTKGTSVAHYMLNPDAKTGDADIKKMQKEAGKERILHIETEYAHPVLISTSPKVAAKTFMNEVTSWTRQNRPGKPEPKSRWEHRVISFHPEDSKELTPKSACAIAKEALKLVAPGERPCLFVVHGDTQHMHVHMLYATVNNKGRIFDLHKDFRRWENAMETLEIKYKLHRVEKRTACATDNDRTRMPDGTNPSKAEFRFSQRTGEPSCKQKLRLIIDQAIHESMAAEPTKKFSQFINTLRSKNVGVSANLQGTGRVTGLRLYYGIFSKAGIKASSLGHPYSWNNLSRTVGFDQNRSLNENLLKVSDYRVRQWTQANSGGKKYAHSLAAMVTSQQSSRKTKAPPSSVQSSSAMATVTFPTEYPDWLKDYLNALVRAVNAEILSQRQHDRELSQSIAEILEMVSKLQMRAIQNVLKEQNMHNSNKTRVTDYKEYTPHDNQAVEPIIKTK
ncbi:relaxase/mobilization nuclease domain-containing protein [Endozoicomonas ascidiicola]|uniref:relaxase/mobilization nuclease domain-containing protein n=1 Tax=Endozoicomonas ascidiicola TaxID=1698521 RepID=UPI000834FA63|nr:relaxase/mobilization nuclease domain-containing protein [Endozoicomonas ascidiicola]